MDIDVIERQVRELMAWKARVEGAQTTAELKFDEYNRAVSNRAPRDKVDEAADKASSSAPENQLT